MKDIETLKKACFAIESEWGEKEADEYFTALFRLKQDLEVLEILRKVVFKKYELFDYVSDSGFIDRGFWVSDTSYECTEFELDEEEYNKVKQWLEENENE